MCCLFLAASSTVAIAQTNVVDLVNPIIGTNGMGHTFPGACVPFGLVQLSPDTDTIPHNTSHVPTSIAPATNIRIAAS